MKPSKLSERLRQIGKKMRVLAVRFAISAEHADTIDEAADRLDALETSHRELMASMDIVLQMASGDVAEVAREALANARRLHEEDET